MIAMPHPIPDWEKRPIDELRRQFEIERELANRLRSARDRRGLYSSVYDEFLERVPHYKSAGTGDLVPLQLQLLEPFLTASTRFLEVGGANCGLPIALRNRVARVIAVEAAATTCEGVEVIVADTPPYPLPDACVDLAFTSHVIEHLLPEDALLHSREMRRVLAPGGRYVCVTPNRLWGPHDVSRYFTDRAEGLHLHEYTHNELVRLLKAAGFRRVRIIHRIGSAGTLAAHLATRVAEALISVRVLERLSRGRQAPLRLFEQVMISATV